MNKQGFFSFLLGLVIGNRGLPVFWHVFYLIVIGILAFMNYR